VYNISPQSAMAVYVRRQGN